MSTVRPVWAYVRYWAVAHTQRRPDVASIASIAAARPTPPNRNPIGVTSPGVTGSFQRKRLCVGSRPRNVRVSTPHVGTRTSGDHGAGAGRHRSYDASDARSTHRQRLPTPRRAVVRRTDRDHRRARPAGPVVGDADLRRG